jgi:hypothetical protein
MVQMSYDDITKVNCFLPFVAQKKLWVPYYGDIQQTWIVSVA